jgi:hypothetical protein
MLKILMILTNLLIPLQVNPGNDELDIFKKKLNEYVRQYQYDWSAQMPVKRLNDGHILNMDIKLFMTDPLTKLRHYPKLKVIVDPEGGFIYDIRKNTILDLSADKSYPADDFEDEFYEGRDNLLKN